jgi:hypothetical protein
MKLTAFYSKHKLSIITWVYWFLLFIYFGGVSLVVC